MPFPRKPMYCVLYSWLASPIGLLLSWILFLVNIFLCFLFLETQLTNFLTITWPELACSLSAPVTCVLYCKWSGPPRAHTGATLLCTRLHPLWSQWGLSHCKERKTPVKRGRCEQYTDQSNKEERCRRRMAESPPYLPTHPRSASVSAGAAQSGRDSKYSTV